LTEVRTFIPTRAGISLAATIWRPAGTAPLPAVLSLMPYQKDGRATAFAPGTMSRFLATQGFATLLVDIRGTGASGGVADGPWSPNELDDGFDVVEWTARQEWCTGDVAMWGVSYGGITSLAVAAERPPSLRTIVPIHACGRPGPDFVRPSGTEGGYWFAAEWAPRMVAYNLMPPLWRDADDHWREAWATRLDDARPWLFAGFGAGTDLPAVYETQIETIEVPTLHIAGWRDLFAAETIRDFARGTQQRRLIVGPWKHIFPDQDPDVPAPIADEIVTWLHEHLDRASLSEDAAHRQGFRIAFYLQDSTDALSHEVEVESGWYGSDVFPPPGDDRLVWSPAPGGLLRLAASRARAEPTISVVPPSPAVGAVSTVWDGWRPGLDTSRFGDQSSDDAACTSFTTDVLEHDLVIIGSPRLTGTATATTPARLCARLSEVTTIGRSGLITKGFSATADDDGGSGGDSRDGGGGDLAIDMIDTAYVIRAGSRMRLSLSTGDFPKLFPDRNEQATLYLADVSLAVPVHRASSLTGTAFHGDLRATELASDSDTDTESELTLGHEVVGRAHTVRSRSFERVSLSPTGECTIAHTYETRIDLDDPDDATLHSTTAAVVIQHGERVEVDVECRTDRFGVAAHAVVTRQGACLLDRSWHRPTGRTG
jgi:hypothetical protein